MSSGGSHDPGAAQARERLFGLIDQIIEAPARRDALSQEISAAFTQRRAVLILDMSGFSRTTQLYGIVAFLVMIQHMRRLALPVIEQRHGTLVKAEADNLYCLFNTVADAVWAAREIVRRLDEANRDLQAELQLYASIGIGYGDVLLLPGTDMFGDEVNLACKLGEDVAQAGHVLLTEAAREALDPAVASTQGQVSVSGLALVYHAVG